VGAELWLARKFKRKAVPMDDSARAHYRGLKTCGSSWACPPCSAKKRRAYSGRLQRTVVAWERDHGERSIFLVTATIRHALGDNFKDARDGVALAWSLMQTGAPWLRLKLKYGLRAIGKSPDVTHGKNGWHPHIHALFFFDQPLDAGQQADFQRDLGVRWSNKIADQLGEEHRPSVEHGLDVAECHKSTYQLKMGFRPDKRGLELTDAAGAKRGKNGSRSPMQIAYDFAVFKRASDGLLWVEYCDAMKNSRMMTWSGDLDVADPTMAESSEELGENMAVKLMDIDAKTWERVRDIPGAKVAILEAAEEGGEPAVRALLARLLSQEGSRPLTKVRRWR